MSATQPPGTGTDDPKHALRNAEVRIGYIGPGELRGRGRGQIIKILRTMAASGHKVDVTTDMLTGDISLSFHDNRKKRAKAQLTGLLRAALGGPPENPGQGGGDG